MKMLSWVATYMRKLCAETLPWLLHNMASLIARPEGDGGGQSAVVAAAAEMLKEWEEVIVAFCLSSPIAIATVSVQIEHKLPQVFKFLSLALLLCFVCVAFGKLTDSIFGRVSQSLYYLGGFLGITALFVATAIPYAPYFQFIIFLIYCIFWLFFLLAVLLASLSSAPPIDASID